MSLVALLMGVAVLISGIALASGVIFCVGSGFVAGSLFFFCIASIVPDHLTDEYQEIIV